MCLQSKIILVLSSLAIFSCSSKVENDIKSDKIEKTATTDENLKKIDVKFLVLDWNSAHSEENLQNFKILFADEVTYYQTKLTSEKCLEKKSSFIQKHPDYEQKIIGEILIDTLSENELKCSFVKEVSYASKTKRYAAYLHFKKFDTALKITVEGDETTDLNLQNKKNPLLNSSTFSMDGDFNGDGKKETFTLIKPAFPSEDMVENFGECKGECNCKIVFSDQSMAPIEINMCIGGTPVNKGDLDGDGKDEIGILPDWWTSCWRSYFVYTYKNGNWDYLVAPISTHCTQWDNDFGFIQKHPSKKGYVIIEMSSWENEDIKVKKKTIKVI
ncbi:MAG: hypothetical protein ACK5B9_00960 [Flavobacteriia bacterium]|jgi:hypothetical protein